MYRERRSEGIRHETVLAHFVFIGRAIHLLLPRPNMLCTLLVIIMNALLIVQNAQRKLQGSMVQQ